MRSARCTADARRGGGPVRARPDRQPVHVRHHARTTPPTSGHAAVYMTYDVLQRRLRDLGHETRCVRNITDVDDSILAQGPRARRALPRPGRRRDGPLRRRHAAPSGCSPRGASLEPPPPSPTSAGFIGMVLDRGHAYQAGGAVYFDVSTFPAFGSVSGYDREQMLAFAAERGGNVEDPYKRDPLDFVLWQPSLEDEPSWDSLWGPGRPGWHIECSALALRELGTTIDLHGGGADLIFPHHECERAQSEAATGEPFVRHWMHQAMVRMDGEKMSKSLGNLVFVSELRKELGPDGHPPRSWSSNHYRTEWEWDDSLPGRRRRAPGALGRPPGGATARWPRSAPPSTTTSTPPRAVAAIDAAAAGRPGRVGRGRAARASSSSLWGVEDTQARRGPVAFRSRRERPRHGRLRQALPGQRRGAVAPLFKSLWRVEVTGSGEHPRRGRCPLLPEPHVGDRLVLPAPRCCPAASCSWARPSTWTRGRPSTSSRPWA